MSLAVCQQLHRLFVEDDFVFSLSLFGVSSLIHLVCYFLMSVLDKEPCSKVLANKCLSKRFFLASECSKRRIVDLI